MSLFEELKRRNVLRVAAAYLVVGWLLTEVLTTLLPAFGAPEWISRSVMLVFALGFLPTIILSWVYEITPEGIKKEHEVDREGSIALNKSKRLEYFTITSVIAGVIFISVFSSRTSFEETASSSSVTNEASVAVLPFVNMSGDSDNAYFSDGLTETLLHMLAQIPELKVAARTSSFAFRDQNKTIVEIATALDVANVLEGSVQRVGDRVRITAQLIRAKDGFHIWSENYDRTLDDIFGIQDEIATRVRAALSASLLGKNADTLIASSTTRNSDAYDLYLQALQSRSTFSYGGLAAAEGLLKGALTIDPDFIDAKTELASNYWQQFETGLMARDVALTEIVAITNQVLAVHADDVTALAIQIFATAAQRAEKEGPQVFLEAVNDLEEIVAVAPTAFQPKILLTRLYQGLQQFAKAVPLMQEALRQDPFNSRIHYELGGLYSSMERRDDARGALQRSLEIEPAQPNALATLAGLSLQSGDGVDYLRQLLRAIEVDPADYELPGIVATFLFELGLAEEADDFRNRVLAIAPTSEIAYQIEMLRAINRGDEETSVATARRAIEDDIDDRHFAFGGAVQHLLRVAARRGTVVQESEYLQQNAPNILDVDAATLPLKYRGAQFAAFDAWYVELPRDEMLRRLERLREIAASFGFRQEQDPATYVGILVLQGKVEEAVKVALEDVFTDSVAVHLDWRRTISQAQYADFVEDSRVQAAMSHWEDEELALREKVRTYLVDLSVSS
ncbi:MAG: tetratricopeptide repeat protein [Proteobacteria bacterium]|nr:tetratricopeptide repeat protein [Pseudomonadota bacterium]